MARGSSAFIVDASALLDAHGIGDVISVFGRTGIVTAQTGDYSISQISGAGTAAAENLSAIIIDNGAGALTIGLGQITAAMLAPGVGGTIDGSIAATQIAFGSGTDAIAGSTNLTFDGSTLFAKKGEILGSTYPFQVSTVSTNSHPCAVAYLNGYVYVANQSGSVQAFSVNLTTGALTLVGSRAVGNVFCLIANGNYVYALGDANFSNGNLYVLDISAHTNPVLVNTIATGGGNVNGHAMAVNGNYLFLTNSVHPLMVYDITTPSLPVFITQQAGSSASGSLVKVTAQGYIFVASAPSSGRTLNSYSFNGTTITHLNTDTVTGWDSAAMAVSGNYVIVRDSSHNVVKIFDGTNGNITLISTVVGITGTEGMVVQGNYLYMAGNASGVGEIAIADISVPAVPFMTATINNVGGLLEGAAVNGNFMYFSDFTNNLIRTFNVASPTAYKFIDFRNKDNTSIGQVDYLGKLTLPSVSDGIITITGGVISTTGGAGTAGNITIFANNAGYVTAADVPWTEVGGALYPKDAAARVLIGGASDDLATAAQTKGFVETLTLSAPNDNGSGLNTGSGSFSSQNVIVHVWEYRVNPQNSELYYSPTALDLSYSDYAASAFYLGMNYQPIDSPDGYVIATETISTIDAPTDNGSAVDFAGGTFNNQELLISIWAYGSVYGDTIYSFPHLDLDLSDFSSTDFQVGLNIIQPAASWFLGYVVQVSVDGGSTFQYLDIGNNPNYFISDATFSGWTSGAFSPPMYQGDVFNYIDVGNTTSYNIFGDFSGWNSGGFTGSPTSSIFYPSIARWYNDKGSVAEIDGDGNLTANGLFIASNIDAGGQTINIFTVGGNIDPSYQSILSSQTDNEVHLTDGYGNPKYLNTYLISNSINYNGYELYNYPFNHAGLANLTSGDPHTQYALLAGRSTPQQLKLGTASGASTGYITSTANATKGKYFLNSAGTMTVDELNVRYGVGIAIPLAGVHVLKTTEQLRLGFDASNYYSTTVGSTGLATFDAVGSGSAFRFNDAVGVGVTPSYNFHTKTALNPATNFALGSFMETTSSMTGNSMNQRGAQINSSWATGANTTDSAFTTLQIAGYLTGNFNADISTLASLIGVQTQLEVSGNGTIKGISAFNSTLGFTNGNTPTITNAIGFYASTPFGAAGGVITNSYGVYIASQTASYITNGFGIYQAGTTDKNTFLSVTGIGSATSPQSMLDVTGTSNASNLTATAARFYAQNRTGYMGIGYQGIYSTGRMELVVTSGSGIDLAVDWNSQGGVAVGPPSLGAAVNGRMVVYGQPTNTTGGTGTVSATAGGTTITGSGTNFDLRIAAGYTVTIGSDIYAIRELTSATSLKIYGTIANTVSGSAYSYTKPTFIAFDFGFQKDYYVNSLGQAGYDSSTSPASIYHLGNINSSTQAWITRVTSANNNRYEIRNDTDNTVPFYIDGNAPAGNFIDSSAFINTTDDAYASGWNGNLQVPTKNAVYDKIELITTANAGNYTPTGTNVTNITSSTPNNATWSRVGNVITVAGSITVTNTLAIASEVDVSLPVASNLGAATDLNGIGQSDVALSTNCIIKGDATNDRASIFFTAVGVGGTGTIFYNYQYKVI